MFDCINLGAARARPNLRCARWLGGRRARPSARAGPPGRASSPISSASRSRQPRRATWRWGPPQRRSQGPHNDVATVAGCRAGFGGLIGRVDGGHMAMWPPPSRADVSLPGPDRSRAFRRADPCGVGEPRVLLAGLTPTESSAEKLRSSEPTAHSPPRRREDSRPGTRSLAPRGRVAWRHLPPHENVAQHAQDYRCLQQQRWRR